VKVPLSAFTAGCRVHAALLRLGDDQRLNAKERAVWPAVSAVRSVVRQLGGKRLRPERSVKGQGYTGRLDLAVDDGGVVEMKVVEQLPAAPRPRDAQQLGAYLALSKRASWGALLYVDLAAGAVRYFRFGRDSSKALAATAFAGAM